jgi:hypothetical protein
MYIKVNSKKAKKMGKEYIILVKGLSLKEVGKIILSFKANLLYLMGILLLVHLGIIFDMKESTNIKMVIFIKENGKVKSKAGVENLFLQMVKSILGNLMRVESMDMAYTNGRTEIFIQAIFH